jgi:hypothetical protein
MSNGYQYLRRRLPKMKNFKKNIIVLLLMAIIMTTFAVQPVSAESLSTETTAGGMIVDLFIFRPLSITATAVGCVVYVVALPFTVWSKDRLNAAGKNLVVVPGEYAFVRPLGDI